MHGDRWRMMGSHALVLACRSARSFSLSACAWARPFSTLPSACLVELKLWVSSSSFRSASPSRLSMSCHMQPHPQLSIPLNGSNESTVRRMTYCAGHAAGEAAIFAREWGPVNKGSDPRLPYGHTQLTGRCKLPRPQISHHVDVYPDRPRSCAFYLDAFLHLSMHSFLEENKRHCI